MIPSIIPSELEINPEPSFFTALALVRKLILKEQEGAAKKGYHLSKLLTTPHSDLENEEILEKIPKKEPCLSIPQVSAWGNLFEGMTFLI